MKTKRAAYIILTLRLLTLAASTAWAGPTGGSTPINRDSTYEQNLRWEASADKTITPAKVLRWMTGLRGQTLSAPSPTEFQPIVNVHDSHVRVIFAIAYKF